MKNLRSSTIFLFLILFVPVMAIAQSPDYSKTEKLFLNFHLNADHISPEDGDGSGGGGFGIRAGYGFSRLFTLYLGLDGSAMNTGGFGKDGNDEEFGLGFFELGGQFNFQTGKPAAIPYAQIALTGQAAIFDPDQGPDITYTGGGVSLGGGLKYFVSKTLALDLGLAFTLGNFSEVEIGDNKADVDINSTSTRLNFGLSWFPFNR